MSNTISTYKYALDAEAVLKSFNVSGKRHLLITGSRASGKTTLLCGMVRSEIPRITTWAEPKNAVYLRDEATGETAVVGRYDPNRPGSENKMAICRDGFDSVGISAVKRCISSDCEFAAVDEIGYLECEHDGYTSALLELLEKKRVIAVVRKQDLPFLNGLMCRDDVFVADTDEPFGNTGCVIMASGIGSRFGGNKLMADFGGVPVIGRVINAAKGIFTRMMAVTRNAETAAYCRSMGIEVILHDLPYRSDTVRLGIEAMGNTDGCIFCQGDQPLIGRTTLKAMALAAKNDKNSIFRASYGGTAASPILFPSWVFGELKELPQGKGGGYAVKNHPECVRSVNADSPYELRDIDTTDDLCELLEYVRQQNNRPD